MYPVLFSLGPFSVSAFGFFLALALLSAVFVSWRLSHIYDLNEEKIFDLAILTFLGGIVGARAYFVILNWGDFGSLEKVVWINRYPGLSLWGGMLGGALALWFFTQRLRLNFWQVIDFAAVSLLIGLVFGDIGCFLGGCAYGAVSDSPIATPIVGLIGRRIPVAILESVGFAFIFFYLWGQVVRFHFSGKIAASFLMVLGVVKFITEFYRGDSRMLASSVWISYGHLWSALVFISGAAVFYTKSKRSLIADISGLVQVFTSQRKREGLLSSWRKSWYNYTLALRMKATKSAAALQRLPKKLKRRLNVKSTPTNIS